MEYDKCCVIFVGVAIAIALTITACSSATRMNDDGMIEGDADGNLDGDGDGGAWEPSHPEDFGDPGWRESEEPLCRNDEFGLFYSPVWADDRGVFVFFSSQGGLPDEGTLEFNDGSGWTSILDINDTEYRDEVSQVMFLTGVPGGEVFIGMSEGLITLDTATGAVGFVNISLSHAFICSSTLGYGVGNPGPQLFQFDGEQWEPSPGDPMPFEAGVVWCNEEVVFAAGPNGLIMSKEGEGWTIHDSGTLETLTSIWGFAEDDVYAGTGNNELLHYDGSSWVTIPWSDADVSDLACVDQRVGLWGGADGTVFGYDSARFFRLVDDHVDVLGRWLGRHEVNEQGLLDCADHFFIHSIWGTSPTDVFLVVSESEEQVQHCEEFLLWWDGAEFHWF